MNVGVIGYGYWGPNLVRNFFEAEGSWISTVCDARADRLQAIQKRYPTIKVTTNYKDVINDPAIDAVAIATPISTHYELASLALTAGKHVLIEKPLTQTSEQAMRLIELARKNKLVLMVDHTFIYSDSVRWIKKLISSNKLGKLYYYDSVRVNLGLFQHDVNVLWDLAPHDISIMNHVLGKFPVAVSATGVANIPGQPVNIAYLTCFFDEALIAHFHVNWLAPVKVRNTTVCGDRRMIVYDDIEPSEKIKIYDKGVVLQGEEGVRDMLINYRIGHMWSPKLDTKESLRSVIEHFIECVSTGKTPITDGEAGLKVVRILEAANLSLTQQGRIIPL